MMGSPNWETPSEFYLKCSKAFGPFDVDLAATEKNAKCMDWITEKKDALSSSWAGLGRAWLNPPYVNLIRWVEKAIEESDNGLLVCMLLPNDTDTKWFHLLLNRAEIYVTKGRIRFVDPEGGGRSSPRQGHIVALLRPPVPGLTRPTGVLGRIEV